MHLRISPRIRRPEAGAFALGVLGVAIGVAMLTASVGARAAVTAPGFEVRPGAATVAPGQTTLLSVFASSGTPPIGAWVTDIRYDAARMSAESCIGMAGSVCNPAFAPGVARVAGASLNGLAGDVEIARLTIRAIGTAGSQSTISIQVQTCASTTSAPLSCSTASGVVTIGTGASSVSATATVTTSATATTTASLTSSATAAPSGTGTGTPTPIATQSSTPSPTPSATPAIPSLVGQGRVVLIARD